MGAFEQAMQFLPEGLQRPLSRVSLTQRRQVQEIRLRRNGVLTLSLPEGEKIVDTAGVLSDKEQPLTVFCTEEDVEKTFFRLCEFSVHSHGQEIRQGFVTAKGGFRAGITGMAVVENGEVTAMRDIRSICLRVAGRHDGCAAALRPLFEGQIPSLLIAGEPSAGKTSFLRDIGISLSGGEWGPRRKVAVIDERGEIAGAGGLTNADVLTGIPKPQGILQAVRTLAPDVILLDELGTVAEVEAIADNLHAGVPAIATAHCRDIEEALSRPAVRLALERRVFDRIVFLQGRDAPGRIREITEVKDLEICRRDRYRDSGGSAGNAGCGEKATTKAGAGNGAHMAV